MQEQQAVDQNGMPMTDENGDPVTKVLYDLSAFDFDIVITTSQASATARRANLYQLLEAKKAGVDIPMDIILISWISGKGNRQEADAAGCRTAENAGL